MVVIYESMYGNTHLVADVVRAGIGDGNEVVVLPVDHLAALVTPAQPQT